MRAAHSGLRESGHRKGILRLIAEVGIERNIEYLGNLPLLGAKHNDFNLVASRDFETGVFGHIRVEDSSDGVIPLADNPFIADRSIVEGPVSSPNVDNFSLTKVHRGLPG